MSILNPFPELLSFALMAPLFLRVVLGSYFLEQFVEIIRARFFDKKNQLEIKTAFKYLIGIKTLGAFALIIGLYTQIAALILLIITVIDFVLEQKASKLKKTKLHLFVFIIAILLTFLVTGAGLLSIDMPL